MNKIHKVIWSKVRNCYVAVSEIAKRNGKGGGAVRGAVVGAEIVGGAKGKSGRVALALSLALCVTAGVFVSPQVASAEESNTITVRDAGNPRKYDSDHTTGGEMTYESDIYFPLEASITVLNITGGTGYSSSSLEMYAYAGYYGNAAASGYTVNISGGIVGANTHGIYGASSSGGVSSNRVIMSQADPNVKTEVHGYVTGGDARGGSSATDNRVEISGGMVSNSVRGGCADGSGSATGNTVSVSGGTMNYTVTGGSSRDGSATDNRVEISGGWLSTVEGGNTRGFGSATGNCVEISGGRTVHVYGGYSFQGSATGNTVMVSQSSTAPSIDGVVYGGYVDNGRGGASDNRVEISGGTVGRTVNGGYVHDGWGNATDNTVTISGGTVGGVRGGYEEFGFGNASGNTVNISQSSAEIATGIGGDVYGGYTYFGGDASSNRIGISGGTVSGDVYGGYTYYTYEDNGNVTGNATGNTVTVSQDDSNISTSITGTVYGGYSYNGNAGGADIENEDGTVTKQGNTVTISGGDVSTVYGGYVESGSGSATSNTVNVSGGTTGTVFGGKTEGSGSVTGNSVNIDAGEVGGFVYGGSSTGDGSGAVSGNIVKAENGSILKAAVYGGHSEGSSKGDVNENKVYITDSEVESGHVFGGSAWNETNNVKDNEVIFDNSKASTSNIFGGALGNSICKGEVSGNKVEISGSGSSVNGVFGGYTGGSATVTGNTVTVENGGSAGSVYGGQAESDGTGHVTKNIVNIKNSGTVNVVYGGQSYGSGAVSGNTVNMTGGTVKEDVYGGYSDSGNAGGAGEGEGNTVNISGGKVANDVVGGKSDEGNATGNTVNMTGGTVGCVLGGWSDNGNVTGNKVTISGGTVQGYVHGGWGDNGSATGNTVIISGGTVDRVVGGCGERDGATGNTVSISGGTMNSVYGGLNGYGGATGNTVILSKQEGKAAPVLCGMIGGGLGNGDIVTGNTLQLEAAGLSAPGIKNFETIRLAGTLAWENGATVFKANQFITNADGTRASLDIKDAETNLAEATNGSMTLLASDTADDFKTLSLIYSGGTEALSETNRSKVVKTGEETTEAAPVNGVTVSSVNTHTVSLDAENSYKNVLYAVESVPTKLTLGEMAWGTGRDLAGKYTFDDTIPIDAANLTFTGAATTALKKNYSATLVSNATGITADNEVAQPTGDAGKTVAVDYTDAAGIHFAATANGHVAAVKDAVNYMVDGVAVNSVNLAGWNGTTSAVPRKTRQAV